MGGQLMKQPIAIATIVTSIAALTMSLATVRPAFAADTDAAARQLTGFAIIRCRDTVADATASAAAKRFACNPGRDVCATTTDGANVCAALADLPRACRLYLHPDWYDGVRYSAETKRFDTSYVNMYVRLTAADYQQWFPVPALPPVTTQTSTSPTECGGADEAKPPAKPAKPVWKCVRKKHGKRKCHKVTPPKPKPPVVAPPADDGAVSKPHHDPAKMYANAVGSLVIGCSGSGITYATVQHYYSIAPNWTTECSLLYYDKLKAQRDAFNAANPSAASEYPSRLIVQQVEDVYLRGTGSAAEVANVQCWTAWWNATPKPVPSGCAG